MGKAAKSIVKTKNGSLTIEELRKYQGFENFSDQEAGDYIIAMEQFCAITYELYIKAKGKSHEES
jgi:hypothetical protein